jgi:lysozyme family protein
MRYRQKWPEYAKQCDTMAIKPERKAEFEKYARYAIDHKAAYLEVANATGVQWYHVAVIHRRESNASFGTYLGNGQSLSRVTTEVPAGRGPFTGPRAFFDGCCDALHLDGLDKVVPPWPLEKILYWCEVFNGSGYHGHGLPSPYLWGGTTIQRPGKFVADHDFEPVWDTQPGCAGILYEIFRLDPTFHVARES